jgi:hypothetical protein
VVVGLLLPAACPDDVEGVGEGEQVGSGRRRKEMEDAVDVHPSARWTPVRLEPEERDDAVDVDEEQWFPRVLR